MLNKNVDRHGRRIRQAPGTAALAIAVASAVVMGLAASRVLAQPVDPMTDPFPVLDFDDPQKSVVVRLRFNDRLDVETESIEVVPERTHGRLGDPPLLVVDVRDLDGVVLETFNAWHPQWQFVENADGSETRTIVPGASGRITCPFQPEGASMTVTDQGIGMQVAEVDLLPATHDFCRDNPDEPDCEDLANRSPVCDANGPYTVECTGATTSVVLDGSESFDPDDDPIASYDWFGSFEGGTASGSSPTVQFAGVGDSIVDLEITDDFGGFAMCQGSVSIVDTTPPLISCNAPPTIHPPDAPISFRATAQDVCAGSIPAMITAYDCFAFTRDGKRIDKTRSCVISISDDTLTVEDSGGVRNNIEWVVSATDASGNTATTTCSISVAHPRRLLFRTRTR
jgi:hypothetical protein